MPRIRSALRQHDRDDKVRDSMILHHIVWMRVSQHEMFTLLREIKRKVDKMEDDGQDILDTLIAAKKSLANVAQDITDIKNSIPTQGGMSAAKTAEVRSAVADLATSLNTLDLENPATTPPPAEVNVCNQAGQDAGACTLGATIPNDDPNLANLKAQGFVDTTPSPSARRR